jgi:hypothetical protein
MVVIIMIAEIMLFDGLRSFTICIARLHNLSVAFAPKHYFRFSIANRNVTARRPRAVPFLTSDGGRGGGVDITDYWTERRRIWCSVHRNQTAPGAEKVTKFCLGSCGRVRTPRTGLPEYMTTRNGFGQTSRTSVGTIGSARVLFDVLAGVPVPP